MSTDFGAPQAISKQYARKPSSSGAGCLFLLFGFLFAIGFVVSYTFLFVPLWNVFRAADWAKTPCTITSSKVESEIDGEGGTSHKVVITYQYEFQGRSHRGDRYSFVATSTSGRASKDEIVKRYPAGSKRVCFVNPEDPSESVLNPVSLGDLWLGLIPFAFAFFGLVGMGFSLRSWLRRNEDPLIRTDRTSTPSSWSPPSLTTFDVSRDPSRGTADGFVALTNSQSVLVGCIVMMFVAVIWDGITGVMVWKVIDSFQKGRPEWFLTFFSIPFVLIGLIVILGLLHTFLRLFNPRPTITMRPEKPCLGQPITLRWKFNRQTSSIRSFKIELIGKERATYRRGTSTYTDEEIFSSSVLLETTSPMEINFGEREVVIPSDTMHSFKSANNEILWVFRIDGDIAWWPNVGELYSIQVEPLPRL